MSFTDKEKDDFWNIEKLVPNKKTRLDPFATGAKTVEHRIDGTADGKDESRKLSFEGLSTKKKTEDTTYIRGDGGLISRVTIKRFVDRFDFYDSFKKAASIYYDFKADRCDFASFYSYMPQYSQFNSAQKNYYFYWRSEARRGRFIKCDYSYLYLYVYEILNLPDKIAPEEGIRLLCRLWREYRNALPKIDPYFSVWVQDYCLVYNLPCPMDEVGDFIFDVIDASEFKEFYLSDVHAAGLDGMTAMVAYLSDYDWRRGKFAGGEHAEEYKRNMLTAMKLLVDTLAEAGYMNSGESVAVINRDAFPHSLCTHSVKCKLEIEYYPISKEERLRSIVTAGVRYTENKLRALYGVKSRLAVKDFPDEYKRLIDSYFDRMFEEVAQKKANFVAPEYAGLYSAPTEELSFAGADEIERASWSTTMRLVDTEEAEEIMRAAAAESADETETVTDEGATDGGADRYGLSDAAIDFIRLAYDGGEALDDALFEEVNEAFSDAWEDIILEHDGEKYTIIEDYKEEIGEWLRKLTK